jgi:hypothetical protein
MSTRAEPFRVGLALLTTFGLVLAMMVTMLPMTALGGHTVLPPDESGCVKVDGLDQLEPDEFPIDIVLEGQDGPVTFSLTGGTQKEEAVEEDEPGEWMSFTYSAITGLADGESVVVTEIKVGVSGNQGPETLNPAGGTISVTGQNAISHLTFCLEFTEPEPEPGQIIIEKEVTEGSDTSVAFTFTATGFTLSDNTLAHGESGSAEVEAGGDYSVTESVPEGWTLQSAACTSTEGGDDSTPGDINVSEGETVTCTFINHEEEEEVEVGTIVVVKEVAEGDPQDVAFTFNATGFVLSDNTLAHGESGTAEVAAGGDYSVSETVLTGWEQVSATCDSTDEADDSTPADINVSDGETVTCTFVNQIEEEVAGTTITTSATTVADEVLDTEIEAEELPFTGIESDLLVGMAVLLLMSGLVVLGLTGAREDT